MRNVKRAIALAAAAASLLAAPVASFAAGGARLHAAEAAARSDYWNAVARCNRMRDDAWYHCMENADAARRSLGRHVLPGAGPAGGDATERGNRGGGRPTYRNMNDIERVPDNLASNASR